jgi:hypothetical protein
VPAFDEQGRHVQPGQQREQGPEEARVGHQRAVVAQRARAGLVIIIIIGGVGGAR